MSVRHSAIIAWGAYFEEPDMDKIYELMEYDTLRVYGDEDAKFVVVAESVQAVDDHHYPQYRPIDFPVCEPHWEGVLHSALEEEGLKASEFCWRMGVAVW